MLSKLQYVSWSLARIRKARKIQRSGSEGLKSQGVVESTANGFMHGVTWYTRAEK